jgi:hypothetical protein
MAGTAEEALLEARRAVAAEAGGSGSGSGSGGGNGSGAAADALSRRAILTALRFAPLPAEEGAHGGGMDDFFDDVAVLATRVEVQETPPRRAPPCLAAARAAAAAGADASVKPPPMATLAEGDAPTPPPPPPAQQQQQAAGGGAPGGDGGGSDDDDDPAGGDDAPAGGGGGGGGGSGGGGDDAPRRVCFSDSPPVGAAAWTLRLRGPQLAPSGLPLELPLGAATTLAELRRRAARAAGLDAPSLRMRAGFPPCALDPDGHNGEASVEQAGLTDRDVLHVEGVLPPGGAPGGAAAAAAAAPPAAAAPARGGAAAAVAAAAAAVAAAGAKRPRAGGAGGSRRFPGKAHRTGVAGAAPGAGANTAGGGGAPTLASLDADALAAAGPLAAASLAAGLAPDISWLRDDAGGEEAALGASLLGAARGGHGGAGAAAAALRRAFSAELSTRATAAEGTARVAAALAGAVRFEVLPDGRLAVTYSAPGARGASAAAKQECVADLPASLLPIVLRLVIGDGSDRVAMDNMAPERFAVVSPRMFWAVVRHGGVGPAAAGGRSFAQALSMFVPGVDFEALGRRERLKPERYRPT